jgi:hypothetical protein
VKHPTGRKQEEEAAERKEESKEFTHPRPSTAVAKATAAHHR